MPPPTLYSICFNYLKDHTEDITSLVGVPFSPIIENILDYLFSSDVALNTSILSVIAESHSKELRKTNSYQTSITLEKAAVKSAIPSLIVISTFFPKFITSLDLKHCNLFNNDLLLLRGFSNLQTLDLSYNNQITDAGVTLIENIATSVNTGGMPYLENLRLCQLKYVTDKSLKFIAKISTLICVDISDTSIIAEVATRFLATKGYKPMSTLFNGFSKKENLKLHVFIKKLSFSYDEGQQLLYHPPFTSHTNKSGLQKELCFRREIPSHTSTNAPPAKSFPLENIVKKRRLNTTMDYFKMVENELLGE